ncbi:MAG: hypothetical protein ACRD2C_18495 [Acidimicrobiales bacterium]
MGEGGFGFAGEFVAEEDGEGLGKVAVQAVVVADVEGLEERLVHEAPDVGAGGEVRVVAVLAELEGVVEGFFDVGEDLVDGGEAGGGGLHPAGDPPLLVLEQVGGDGVAVVEFEQLAALVVELGEQGLLLSPLDFGIGASGAETGVDVLA